MATTKKKKTEAVAVEKKPAKYWYAVGRRKTSIAQVRLFEDDRLKPEETSIVNGKSFGQYFPTETLQNSALAPLKVMNALGFNMTVVVRGGGVKSQSEAVSLGVARALVLNNPEIKKALREAKLMTRDARAVERKKPGLKKARKAPQWAKR
ncbi:30S ribosomal protein S9 [Patescibacteria group bacterium]|nr:MAG: 30S ribosomal protein S9 [Patescibacteria group bacterium]